MPIQETQQDQRRPDKLIMFVVVMVFLGLLAHGLNFFVQQEADKRFDARVTALEKKVK